MIRMKRFSRSSRPTGPKMRVPRGSPPSLISTAAFSSKLLHAGAGKGILHGRHDDVTDARVSPAAAAEHTDAEDLLGTRVVGDLEPRLLLDHVNS
jgi:hypothetical protein